MTSSAYSSVAAEQDLAGFDSVAESVGRRSSDPDTGASFEAAARNFVVTLNDIDNVEDAAHVTIGRAKDVVPGRQR